MELVALARVVEVPDAPRGRPGPVVAGGARHQQTTPLREQRQRRARDRRRQLLENVVAALSGLAGERGWERVIVSGGQALTAPLIRALPAPLHHNAIGEDRHLIEMESAAVARIVGELLEREQSEWDARLTHRIRDAAMAGRGGALGLSEVTAALNDARVEHLVYDPAIRYAGALAGDGRLVVPPEAHPLGKPLTAEPRLTERIVERCLATGARVTPVTGPAVEMLADMGGIAARLRW
jgi:Bacterial archaeo-eukaryotic release factor family 10